MRVSFEIKQFRLNGDKFTFSRNMHLKIDDSSFTTLIFVQSNALLNENAPSHCNQTIQSLQKAVHQMSSMSKKNCETAGE